MLRPERRFFKRHFIEAAEKVSIAVQENLADYLTQVLNCTGIIEAITFSNEKNSNQQHGR